jgi:dimethylamine monooxygenase subunit A
MRFFPFGERFDPGMGGRTLLADETLVDVDVARYGAEVAQKRAQLGAAPSDYFLAPPELDGPSWEVLELTLGELARCYPEHFELHQQGARVSWHSHLLGEASSFTLGDAGSLPLHPLDWLGRQLQEDLLLVRADELGTLVGGQLCFPNGWDLPERAGCPYLAIHERTPASTMPGVQAGGRLLQALKPGRTFCRLGWNLKLSSQLDLSTKHLPAYLDHAARRAPELDAAAVARELFIRVERQTFTRLTRSAHVLFAIHTYLSAVEVEASDPDRARRLLLVLSEAPSDVKRYKAIPPLQRALFEYLSDAAAPRSARGTSS